MVSTAMILVFGITIFNYNVHYPNLYAFGQEITEPKNYGKLKIFYLLDLEIWPNHY